MTYIKWRCKQCEDIVISNSYRHHQIDFCKCSDSGCDAEEGYTRMSGYYEFIKSYDYNFFDELVLCMKEQGFLEFVDIGDKRIYLDIIDVIEIKQLEDKMLESLK